MLASATLNAKMTSKHKAQTRIPSAEKTTTLTTYPQVVNYLLRTYVLDENIIEVEDNITAFLQTPNQTSSQYVKKIVAKEIQCGDVNKEHDLNEIFIKGLDKLINRSIRGYWASSKTASLQDLAFRAMSLLKLQGRHTYYQIDKTVENCRAVEKLSEPRSYSKRAKLIRESIERYWAGVCGCHKNFVRKV